MEITKKALQTIAESSERGNEASRITAEALDTIVE